MSEHPIEGLMGTTLQHIRDMMDVNTIIGDQIVTSDGTMIIPVSKVSLGYAAGGSDFSGKQAGSQLFGGGGGAGGTIVPVAFLVVAGGEVKLLQISQSTTAADKAVSLVPELFDKIAALFPKKDKAKKAEPAAFAEAETNEDA